MCSWVQGGESELCARVWSLLGNSNDCFVIAGRGLYANRSDSSAGSLLVSGEMPIWNRAQKGSV